MTLRQGVELALARDEHVENRIGQQRQRQSPCGAACPNAPLRRRHDVRPATIASVKRRAWNAPPSGAGTGTSPYPTRLDNRRFEASHAQRHVQTRRRSARVEHDVRVAPTRSPGEANRTPQRARDCRPRRVDVDQLDVAAARSGRPATQSGSLTVPAPTTETRSPTCGRASQIAVDRRFEVGRQNGALRGGTPAGSDVDRLRRH